MNTADFLFELQRDLPFLSLSLVICALFVWLAHFRLRRRLPAPGRQLATLFVAIHALLLVIHYAAFLTGPSLLPPRLWDFDGQFTLASLNAAMLTLLLGTTCFLNAIARPGRRRPGFAYWIFPAVLLTGLSQFEFAALSRWLIPRELAIVLSGLFLAVNLLILILRYRRDAFKRFCLLLLPVGLGIWAFGYLLDDAVILNIDRVEPLEETVELLGIAVALAGAAGFATANGIRPAFGGRKFLAGVCLSMALVIVLHLGAPVWKATVVQRVGFLWTGIGRDISADLLDGALALRGWSPVKLNPGKQRTIEIWLYATRPPTSDFGFTFQLLDQESGVPIASANKRSGIDVRNWTPGILHSAFPSATLVVPPDAPTNRAMWLALSFWEIDGDDFPPLPIDSSDFPLLGDTHILLEEYVFRPAAERPDQAETLGDFGNGFALRQAVIPARARAGETMEVEFTWSSDSDGAEDWIQFLHFAPQGDGSFWNVDQPPLGPRLPTRLWYAGLRDGEQWAFTVPADLAAGRYDVYTGLYRLTDMQRLELTLADGRRPEERRIPLGSIVIGN